ncbi:hypothetical protein BDN70DRAFT_873964 [Pholiota conissans]|uniref:DUF3533 domain-containing protein n=1 Tax=Pholiota conissans TaxID=109636 RepID=A0A9P5Z896_9AGAR|nr:hypothetical protein BDN70DRAFT_873964 [Pholiota conissans]
MDTPRSSSMLDTPKTLSTTTSILSVKPGDPPSYEEEKAVGQEATWSPEPFSRSLWQKGDQALAHAWTAYLKTLIPALLLITITIFAMFAMFWGALWKIPTQPISGWIVDFDGGEIGQAVVQGLTAPEVTFIRWTTIPSTQFAVGVSGLMDAMKDEKAWVAVAINDGATARLQASISSPNASYDGTMAITAFGVEARNENAYRNYVRQALQDSLDDIRLNFTTRLASQISSTPNLASLLSISPQTVINPVSYQIVNLLPFSQPVATAATFVGLIFLMIMTFFVVIFSNAARLASGLGGMLTLRSLIAFRLLSSFVAYFILSLWYSLLNLAFKLDIHHTFGKGGFVVFWMATWVYMLAVGMALESLILILKQFVPFFLIAWIIVNASINLYPLEVLPKFFHYGYGAPFYNYSKIIRTIVFGTKNELGLHFGVLIVWIAISCISLAIIQWNARRLDLKGIKEKKEAAKRSP